MQTETFLNKVYEGNVKGLVSTLIQKDLLTPDDYEDLKKYWRDGEQKNECMSENHIISLTIWLHFDSYVYIASAYYSSKI